MAYMQYTQIPTPVTVTTPGTAVQAQDPTVTPNATPGILVTAPSTNAGSIYVGDVDVTSDTGTELLPGEGVEITPQDVNGYTWELLISDIYVDADEAGDKAKISYLKRKE